MAFVAVNRFPHPVNDKIVKIGRIVVLPHWQGYNIGMQMVETIIEELYMEYDVRLSTTLPIVQSYLWKNKHNWRLTFQGIFSVGGENAKMAKKARQVYMETYQFDTYAPKPKSINRAKCPPEKKKYY